jgi:imidazolonepropionase-like amidohydrolase
MNFSFIKLMHESGAGLRGDPLPMPSHELQSALVQAAHKHGLITLAHALTQKDTLAILAAGTDALAHSFCDEPPRDELLAAYRKNNSFLIPTLTVSATLSGDEKKISEQFVGHALAGKFLDEPAKTCYCGRMMMAKDGSTSEYSYQVVRMLHEGGIDIVA